MSSNNQLQFNQEKALVEREYKPNLINALISGNKQEINLSLKQYKTHNGAVNYPSLFKIDSSQRLPELSKKDYANTCSLLTAGLTLAFEALNLSRPMSNGQVLDLAETILESSEEDNLAMEDVMLFLQKLVRGEYGKLYESMDISKFMGKFEVYREERFRSIKEIRYEQSVQHKALPINDRIVDTSVQEEKGKHRNALKQYLKNKK